MKKLLAAISLALYLALTCGIVINFHYCMDELASVELFEEKDSVCDRCGMENSNSGCCRDEITVLKLENDQQQPATISFELPGIPNYTIPAGYTGEMINADDPKRDWQNHSPPLLSKQDTYLVNKVFRI